MLGLALSSAACASLPEASAPMGVAGLAPAPRGFVQFCERQLADCGATPAELAGMKLASDHAAAAPAVAAITYDWSAAFAEQRRRREQALAAQTPAPVTVAVNLSYDWSTAFAQDRARRGAAVATAAASAGRPAAARTAPSNTVALNSKTWSLLSRTNDSVNRAIAQRSDQDIYGLPEVWATPIASGVKAGDCEDYVLEKRKALVAAGLPAAALSIAVVTTDRNETHAVLLVATDKGDYVLDSLSAWILPWAKTGYVWRERQVEGSASQWAFAVDGRRPAPSELLLASLR